MITFTTMSLCLIENLSTIWNKQTGRNKKSVLKSVVLFIPHFCLLVFGILVTSILGYEKNSVKKLSTDGVVRQDYWIDCKNWTLIWHFSFLKDLLYISLIMNNKNVYLHTLWSCITVITLILIICSQLVVHSKEKNEYEVSYDCDLHYFWTSQWRFFTTSKMDSHLLFQKVYQRISVTKTNKLYASIELALSLRLVFYQCLFSLLKFFEELFDVINDNLFLTL